MKKNLKKDFLEAQKKLLDRMDAHHKNEAVKAKGVISKFLHWFICLSMVTKLMTMLVTIFILIAAITVPFFYVKYTELLENTTRASMVQLVNTNAEKYTEMMQSIGVFAEYPDYEKRFGGQRMEGIASSSIYIVAADGTMIYHKQQDKVGQPVENAAISQVCADITNGVDEHNNGYVEYLYKGNAKLCAYQRAEYEGGDIIVLTADKAELFARRKTMIINLIIIYAITAVSTLIVGYFLIKAIAHPVVKMTGILEELSKLDLSDELVPRNLVDRKDEMGRMAVAIGGVATSFRNTVSDIKLVAENLNANAEELSGIAVNVNEYSADNSATSEEISAGMEETSASTELINENVGEIEKDAGRINNLATDGEKMAVEIKDRATEMKGNAVNASNSSKKVSNEISVKTEEAIERSKAIKKINELTETIRGIASQTRLLSLNASIEAARAGENGRGFAVVASEIGTLAEQSTTAVNNISDIVAEVQQVTDDLTDNLTGLLEYLNTTVQDDYKRLISVSGQYSDDAEKFENFMHNINESVAQLDNTIQSVATSIDGINSTINETTIGITDIAKKTSDTVALTGNTSKLAQASVQFSEQLMGYVNQFKF